MTLPEPRDAERRRQADWNRQTAANWSRFAPHRARVTELLAGLAGPRPRPRLAVLGAGNANDLELRRLLESFAEITLVDWDARAVEQGVARQFEAPEPRVRIAAAIDVTDPAAELQVPAPGGWRSVPPFDVVASIGLLSQLLLAACRAIDDPALLTARVREVRENHLDCLTRWTAERGAALVTFEIVSSETLPDLATVDDVAALLPAAVAAGNFFTGLHPSAVAQAFGGRTARGGFARQEWVPPWRWDLGPRSYAVAALRLLGKTPPSAGSEGGGAGGGGRGNSG